MNVVGSAAVKLPKLENEEKNAANLYLDPPNYELSLDDFEVYALKRLKVRVGGDCNAAVVYEDKH